MAATELIKPKKTLLAGVLAVEARSKRAYDRHTHDEFGIGLVLAGAQDSASGRGPVRAERGEIITVNPGEVHDGRPVGDGPRHWQMLYLVPGLLEGAFAGLDLPAGTEFAHPVLHSPAAARDFRSLHEAVSSASTTALGVESLLIGMVSHLADRRRAVRIAAPGAIMPARRRLDETPEAELRLEQLAALCGLSRFHFLRAFKTATGLPPHAYQVQRRLQVARRMIVDGAGLAEAAASAGFADQSHLNRHFQRAYGYTPGKLAKA